MIEPSRSESLEDRLAAIRERRGDTVEVSEVGAVVAELMDTVGGDLTPEHERLRNEIEGLAEYIRLAKNEIAAIEPRVISDRHIPAATDELGAVVQATEEATGAILDAAEELEALGSTLEGAQAAKITEVTTKIYEASNFQDVTGQRITKVVNTLRHIEKRILALSAAFSGGLDGDRDAQKGSRADNAPVTEVSLLSGPQLPGSGPQLPGAGNSQDDIDRLFDSIE